MTSVVASGFRSRRLGETGEAPWQTAGWRGSTRGEAGCAGKRWNDSLMEERSVEGFKQGPWRDETLEIGGH